MFSGADPLVGRTPSPAQWFNVNPAPQGTRSLYRVVLETFQSVPRDQMIPSTNIAATWLHTRAESRVDEKKGRHGTLRRKEWFAWVWPYHTSGKRKPKAAYDMVIGEGRWLHLSAEIRRQLRITRDITATHRSKSACAEGRGAWFRPDKMAQIGSVSNCSTSDSAGSSWKPVRRQL